MSLLALFLVLAEGSAVGPPLPPPLPGSGLTWGGVGLRRFHVNPGGIGPDADVTIFDEGDTDILVSQVSVDALQLGRR